jgi:hypothetical protein
MQQAKCRAVLAPELGVAADVGLVLQRKLLQACLEVSHLRLHHLGLGLRNLLTLFLELGL